MTHFKVHQSDALAGRITLPGDKSLSHRAVILGSIACGQTRISGLLRGEDVKRTMDAFRLCGVHIDSAASDVVIEGVGLDGLEAPQAEIYCGNSGTSIRLLTGLFAGQRFETVLTGDDSLSARPMRRVVDPLQTMGADIALAGDATAPIHIRPAKELKPVDWRLAIPSAQVKSAIILAAIQASGRSRVTEPVLTRDYTESLLRQFGCELEREGAQISIVGKSRLLGQDLEIPADFSSAAFFIVAALLVPGSDLVLQNVGINHTRTGLLSALSAMGALIALENKRMVGAEPVADLRVRYSADRLSGTEVGAELVPLMIDEIPILAIAAAAADGRTVLSGCEELRVKESDRIHAVARGLESIGVGVEEHADGMIITGGKIRGGEVESFGDHRIAMAFAIAGAVSTCGVEVMNCDCVKTSFPAFHRVTRQCGIEIESGLDLRDG